MSLDITPLLPQGRQVIHAYGGGKFEIAGKSHAGPVLVFPEKTVVWPVAGITALGPQDILPLFAGRADIEILLIGCGAAIAPMGDGLRKSLSAAGIILEAMDTGAACRTFNVLVAEDRRVAAALIPVD